MDNDIIEGLLEGGSLGTFFGLLRYAQDFLTEPRPAFKWWIWAIKGVTAGAVGLLAVLVPLEFHWPLAGGIIFVALAGWGGVETLNAGKEAMFDALRRWVNARDGAGAGASNTKPPMGGDDHVTEG